MGSRFADAKLYRQFSGGRHVRINEPLPRFDVVGTVGKLGLDGCVYSGRRIFQSSQKEQRHLLNTLPYRCPWRSAVVSEICADFRHHQRFPQWWGMLGSSQNGFCRSHQTTGAAGDPIGDPGPGAGRPDGRQSRRRDAQSGRRHAKGAQGRRRARPHRRQRRRENSRAPRRWRGPVFPTSGWR